MTKVLCLQDFKNEAVALLEHGLDGAHKDITGPLCERHATEFEGVYKGKGESVSRIAITPDWIQKEQERGVDYIEK